MAGLLTVAFVVLEFALFATVLAAEPLARGRLAPRVHLSWPTAMVVKSVAIALLVPLLGLTVFLILQDSSRSNPFEQSLWGDVKHSLWFGLVVTIAFASSELYAVIGAARAIRLWRRG